MKYQTKPKIVEAVRWDGTTKALDEIETLAENFTKNYLISLSVEYYNRCLFIRGEAINTGEYLIFYDGIVRAIDEAVFETQYEPVE